MAVYNLGIVGRDTQDSSNQYSDFLMKFLGESAINEQKVAGQKEVAQVSAQADIAKSKIESQADLQKKLAEMQRKDYEHTRDVTEKAMQVISDKYKDKNDIKMFIDSEHGKALVTSFRDTHPEMKDIKEDVELFPPSSIDQISTQLKEKIAEIKLKIAENPDKIDPKVITNLNILEGQSPAIAKAFYNLSKADPFFADDLNIPISNSTDLSLKERKQAALAKLQQAIKFELGGYDVDGVNLYGGTLSGNTDTTPRAGAVKGLTADEWIASHGYK